VLGARLIVTVIGIAMFGIGELFPADWERRQVDKHLERRGSGDNSGNAQADRPPPG